ncbi:uncharacterized protein LACBIDRAFT_318576 [Laccaria bicolor S238N-H82]|uniref:Predicted protein n=1 Tax=Laccaria bicolor (strain S238N-H82 / ATCC MYA-4686) TaxID=486041 RepID=B0E2Q0_LACBS|nr:uncharacterized protein LACBIDRAFT_318576 [Laccaria bicolor S238N-H82]EDQ98891.1 predicted protein [Laccaria bicolor S238N-H82]|eukprot:XP_001890470.1 predicted protein [Laccaria bicolor S238N-H82]
MDTLNGCLCGVVLHSECNGLVKCKRVGCETQWCHLQCVALEIAPRNWVCEALEDQRDHDDDVTLPYIGMCLIT